MVVFIERKIISVAKFNDGTALKLLAIQLTKRDDQLDIRLAKGRKRIAHVGPVDAVIFNKNFKGILHRLKSPNGEMIRA